MRRLITTLLCCTALSMVVLAMPTRVSAVSGDTTDIDNVDRGCINFCDFSCPTTVFYTGDYENPYRYYGLVDSGYHSRDSRHTVNYITGMTDSMSNHQLSMIPPGDSVSVRLGNIKAWAEAEAICYRLSIPAGAKKSLLINYAPVLEAPGHGPDHDPYFKIELLDMNGQLLNGQSEMVLSADIFNSYAQWNQYVPVLPAKYFSVLWHDWTYFAYDLSAYAGRDIKVRLTTADCAYGAHFGYVYFTLDCEDMEIDTDTVVNGDSISFMAPKGFAYEWRKKYPTLGPVVSTKHRFAVASTDTSIYSCRVNSKYYTSQDTMFSVTTLPKIYTSNFVATPSIDGCINTVGLENASIVSTVNGVLDEECKFFRWDFGNGEFSDMKDPEDVVYPLEGGEFDITLIVGNEDNLDTMRTTVVLPSLVPDTIDTYISLCDSELIHNGESYKASGDYVVAYKGVNECDSVIENLHVKFVTEYSVYDTVSINADEIYELGRMEYSVAGDYEAVLYSENGCDSVVYLHLIVNPIGTGVGDVYANEGIIIHPSPVGAGEFLTIDLGDNIDLGDYDELTLDLLDVNGRVLGVVTYVGSSTLPAPKIAGIYLLRVRDGDNVVLIDKLVVQ